ncbi:MAG TPA: hypothetical protein VF495_00240 [Phenylobacterium sp.]
MQPSAGVIRAVSGFAAELGNARSLLVVDEAPDLRDQAFCPVVEADDHGLHPRGRVQALEGQRMTNVRREHGEEGGLCAAIALPEEVDRVQLTEEVRRRFGKLIGGQPMQVIALRQPTEELAKFLVEALRVTERTAVLEGTDRSWLAGPVIDIPEEMVMDRPEVVGVERAIRKGLFGPLGDGEGLEGL